MRLADFERRWLLTIFDTVLPTSDPRFALEGARLSDYIEHLMVRAPRHFALGLRLCAWLLQLCPLLLMGRLRSFGGLGREERVALLNRLGRARHPLVGEIPLLFKMSACLGVCGLPGVQRAIGITPTDASPPPWARAAASGRRQLPTLGPEPGPGPGPIDGAQQ